MTLDSAGLRPILDPTSIIVVGASDDPDKPAGRVLRYLDRYGFEGQVYPVNPRRETVQGRPAWRSIADLPHGLDLAVVVVPSTACVDAVSQLADQGVKAAIIFSSGFSETGPEGRALQDRLSAVAQERGIRLIGPNCVGVVSARSGLTATFMTGLDQDRFDLQDSGIAFVSQSGAMGGFILNKALTAGVGVGTFISTGNEADVDLGELIGALAEDPRTRAILAYVEGIRDVVSFEAGLALARLNRVPVVIMKVGRSERGAAAAVSHTGSLAGADRVFDGVLARHGAIRVHDIDEMLDTGRALAAPRRMTGRNLSVVTISGGAGALITDACEDVGLEVFEWAGPWRDRMAELLPDFASVTNPIDTTGAIASDQSLLIDALSIALDNPESDAVMVLLGNLEAEEDSVCEGILTAAKTSEKPLFVTWVGGSGRPEVVLNSAGIPTFGEPVRAVRAVGACADFVEGSRRTAVVPAVRVPLPPEAQKLLEAVPADQVQLDEADGKILLSAMGLQTVPEDVVTTFEEADRALSRWGMVVVKLLSDTIAHKSDLGVVRTGITTSAELREACDHIVSVGHGLGLAEPRMVVQPHLVSDIEIILGMTRDPVFGPTVVLGLGGVLAEVLDDVQVRPAPVTVDECTAMIRSLRGRAVLEGIRGRPGADLIRLAAQVATFSEVARALPETVESIDVNPLLIDPDGNAVAVDALVVLRPSGAV